MRKTFSVAVLFAAMLFAEGCWWCPEPPIDQTTFEMQQPAVQAATEAATDVVEHWDDYNDDQQKAMAEANRDAWISLNAVYNPPPEAEEGESEDE